MNKVLCLFQRMKIIQETEKDIHDKVNEYSIIVKSLFESITSNFFLFTIVISKKN